MYSRYIAAFGNLGALRRLPVDRHHIFGGKSRIDLPSNLIRINRASHSFCHDHPPEGRIACVYYQTKSGAAVWSEFNESAGCQAIGLIESSWHKLSDGAAPIYQHMWEGILEHFKASQQPG